jgi:hypothetical protein
MGADTASATIAAPAKDTVKEATVTFYIDASSFSTSSTTTLSLKWVQEHGETDDGGNITLEAVALTQ